MIKKTIQITIASILIGVVSNTYAGLITYTDEATFLAAAGTVSTEDFSGEADGSFTSRDFGDFEATLINPDSSYYPSITNETLQIQEWDYNSSLEFTFDSSLMTFGFDWTNTDTTGDVMELLVSGTSFAFGPSRSSGFFGVISDDSALTGLALSDTIGNGGACSDCSVDNLRYGNGPSEVPEPASIALLGIGLAGLGFSRRKQRSA